jgi:TPR repeat protein
MLSRKMTLAAAVVVGLVMIGGTTVGNAANCSNTLADDNLNKLLCGEPLPPEQIEAWRKAAEQGDMFSQVNLGLAYNKGSGVEKDDKEAFRWWHMAAEQGNIAAENYIGAAYHNGLGIEKNEIKSKEWYNKTAKICPANIICKRINDHKPHNIDHGNFIMSLGDDENNKCTYYDQATISETDGYKNSDHVTYNLVTRRFLKGDDGIVCPSTLPRE